jgi:hypothetical protein
MQEANFEDLAFGVRTSRKPDGVGLRVCLNEVSYAAAEKALKEMGTVLFFKIETLAV